MEKYTSTRDKDVEISAFDAIIKGFSDDGGLFVLPDLADHNINIDKVIDQSYQEIAFDVVKTLLPDFSDFQIANSIHEAYDDGFDDYEVTPIKAVDNFSVLELFHGPTCAFKDVGLQLLPKLMQQCLPENKHVMVLAATSGDTGTAALAGFKDVDKMGAMVFYPQNGVSMVQQQQMLTTKGYNTKVAAINGNFDDAQTNVKKIFNNHALKEKLGDDNSLSSANSINIGRLVPQIVYYFDAYKQMVKNGKINVGDEIIFTVPTGNFGDVLAGYYAKLLGLPVKKLVIACNSNKVLADFFKNGVYDRNRPFFKTIAPSMDIQISSNFERLLYYKSGENVDYVKSLMDDLEHDGKYEVLPEILESIKEDFICGYSDDDEIKASIKEVFEKYHYLMDPHTASGYRVTRETQAKYPDTPVVMLSTASPYKFVDAVSDAIIGEHRESPIETSDLLFEKTGIEIPEQLRQIWHDEAVVPAKINPNEMEDLVVDTIKDVFENDKSNSARN